MEHSIHHSARRVWQRLIRDRGEKHVSDSEEEALAVDHRGGIILAGMTDDLSTTRFDSSALLRLGPNGLIDRSFGSHGYVSTGGGNLWPGVDNEIRAIAIEPNGDIVVAGSSKRSLQLEHDGGASRCPLHTRWASGYAFWL